MSSHWIEPLESRQLLSGAPHVVMSAGQLVFCQSQGALSAPQTITLKNTGSAPLSLASISVTGAEAADFVLYNTSLPAALKPHASLKLKLAFFAPGPLVCGASLEVASNDPATPVCSVALRGLGTTGQFETNEPSLQRILDALQIPVNVGDRDPSTNVLDGPGPSDEVPMQLLQKAGPGPVRLTTLAAFCWDTYPVARFGWYTRGTTGAATSLRLHELNNIPHGYAQSLLPKVRGSTRFDPRNTPFGLYSKWPSQTLGIVASQDALNNWDLSAIDHGHKLRFYPYKTPDGQVVPNSYVVAFEQAFNSDFQDAVMLIQNVKPYVP